IHKPVCRPRSADETWAIRILSNNSATRTEKPMHYFRHELIKGNDHPIFIDGEYCPVTKRFGIPLIIYSMGICKGASAPNEIAIKLRVETKDGFAPEMWQLDPGECLVMGEDRKPLTMALLEAVYSFIAHLMSYPILKKGWAPWDGLLNPSVWQMYGMRYYEEQQYAGRPGFGHFFPAVDC
ncbi:hypothetical protein GYMLUDRAFT_177772, partial [Collybiopsis luxurians FD-317 M1]